jgi:hypothetical protein
MIAPAELRVEFLAAIPNLRAFATIFCGRIVRADDLVQKTLIRARENGGSFEPGSNLAAWRYTIFRDEFYTEIQKPKQGTQIRMDSSHPNGTAISCWKVIRTALISARRWPSCRLTTGKRSCWWEGAACTGQRSRCQSGSDQYV